MHDSVSRRRSLSCRSLSIGVSGMHRRWMPGVAAPREHGHSVSVEANDPPKRAVTAEKLEASGHEGEVRYHVGCQGDISKLDCKARCVGLDLVEAGYRSIVVERERGGTCGIGQLGRRASG
jgi:hypothetical protein